MTITDDSSATWTEIGRVRPTRFRAFRTWHKADDEWLVLYTSPRGITSVLGPRHLNQADALDTAYRLHDDMIAKGGPA